MEYTDYNDYEILNFIAEGNEDASNIIIQKYTPLINSIASKMIKNCNNNGIEYSDLQQEGFIGLDYAIKHFSEEKNVVFFTYVKTCIERKMLSYLMGSTRKKHKFLNESVSFDSENNMLDKLLRDEFNNPELIVENSELEKILINETKKKLTNFENQVFDLMLSDLDYKEIADFLEKDKKAIDNAIQRIRIKVREVMKKEEKKDKI